MRRPPWHVRWALLALLFQPLPWLGFFGIAQSVYGDSPWLPAGSERPLTLSLLAVSALGSAALAGVATYLLLRRARLRVAVPLVLFCCVPAFLGAAVYAHALLVFLAVV